MMGIYGKILSRYGARGMDIDSYLALEWEKWSTLSSFPVSPAKRETGYKIWQKLGGAATVVHWVRSKMGSASAEWTQLSALVRIKGKAETKLIPRSRSP